MSSANRNLNLSMQRFRSSLTSVRKPVIVATLIAGMRFAINSPNEASFWKTPETECAGRESSPGPCVPKDVRAADDSKIAQHFSAGLRNNDLKLARAAGG